MTQEEPVLSRIGVAVKNYWLAIVSIAIALGVANLLHSAHIEGVEFPILLLAIAVTVWFAGIWPGILALILATLGFNYYFTPPRFSFAITRADILTMWSSY